jgi:hypothetical protein
MRQAGGIRRVLSDDDRDPCQRLRKRVSRRRHARRRRAGRAMGEQHANGWRVSRHRLVADATVGVIAKSNRRVISLRLLSMQHPFQVEVILARPRDLFSRVALCTADRQSMRESPFFLRDRPGPPWTRCLMRCRCWTPWALRRSLRVRAGRKKRARDGREILKPRRAARWEISGPTCGRQRLDPR